VTLSAIARELDALTSALHDLQARAAAAERAAPGPTGTQSAAAARSWADARVTCQVDALHVRLDALTAEVHRIQGAARRRPRSLDAAG